MMAMSGLPTFRPPQIADKWCNAIVLSYDGRAVRGACMSVAALMQRTA
jgi:hypothetical protein